MFPVKFRTETAYGESGHSPAEILAYECFELENIYLIEDLLDLLERHTNMNQKKPSNFLKKARQFYKEVINEDTIDYQKHIPFMTELLTQISHVIHMEINQLLWLTDFQTVLDLYGDNIEKDTPDSIIESIDAYETMFPLIEIPYDGTLYAYTEKPEPLPKSYVKAALDNLTPKGDITTHVRR